jgi:hypothetical protein
MNSKKAIMHNKLAVKIMNKSSIDHKTWSAMSADEVMKLTQFPRSVREMIINLKRDNSKITPELESKINEELLLSAEQSTSTSEIIEDYDTEKAINEVLSDFVSTEFYTEDEIKAALVLIEKPGKNWFILSKKVSSLLSDKQVNPELLERIAKEFISK